MEQDKKIKGNAVSAYFMIFISLLFLFNKDNKYLNNSFVKAHTKTAFWLHLMLLVTYVVFISFGLGKEISFLWYNLNNIIASSLFIALFAMMLYGIYRANKWETLTTNELLTLSRQDTLVNVEKREFNEKQKVSMILAYVPLIGYIIYGQDYKNDTLRKINKVALIAWGFIGLLYVLGSTNLALLFGLFYIVLIVFSSIILITKEEFLHISLEKIPTPQEKLIWVQSLCIYMKKYFSGKEFHNLKDILQNTADKKLKAESDNTKLLEKKENIKIPKVLIYVPFLVLICLPGLKSRYALHIKNSLGITILIMVSWALFGIQNMFQVLTIFPIAYGIWFIDRLGYQMPFAYQTYEIIFESIIGTFLSIFKKWNKIHKTEKKENLKVKKTTTAK